MPPPARPMFRPIIGIPDTARRGVSLGGKMAEAYGSIIDTGFGTGNPAIGFPVTDPDPTRDYIYTGPGRLTPGIPQILPQEIDDLTRAFGFKTYEAMLTDPAVSSSYLALKLAILDGPTRVTPAIRPKGYRQGQKYNVEKAGSKLNPKEKRAVEIAEFCERENKRLKVSFKSVLSQILDMMAFGHKLAEMTRLDCEFGPDKGKLGIKAIKIKPHWAWKFIVDSTMDVKGYLTYVPPDVFGQPGEHAPREFAQGGFCIVPPEKFILATWLPRDNDPRGTSALRAAYDWWNLKRQSMPFYYQHLRRFGSPSLDGVLAPGDNIDRYPVDPNTGLELTAQAKVSPIQRFMQTLLAFQNNSVLVRPAGSELNVLEPKSDGEAFLKGFDLFDRQICLAIGLQARSSLEAKHGSKADSDSSVDTRGLVISHGREELGEIIGKQFYYESVKLNFGEDDAEELTPSLIIGNTESQDKPTMIAACGSVGFTIGESQLEEMDAMLDLPERDHEADLKAAQEKAQAQTDMMAASKPAGGQPPSKGGAPAPKSAPDKAK